MTFKVGLLINPYAGVGGAAGLKGSDGAEIVEMALAQGALPKAQARCIRALKRIAASRVLVYTVAGAMGEHACCAAGVNAQVVSTPPAVNDARDTFEACRALLAENIDLLLFGGGDGTARDVMAASGTASALLLGIPCGVKMYSGVYARTPEHAGDLVRQCAEGHVSTREAEVLDIDEQATRCDRISTRLYGYARVPAHSRHMQSAKAGSTDPDRAVAAAAQLFANQMLADHLYFLGPGRTLQALARQLDGDGTLLGVDAYLGQKLVCRDASEHELLALASQHPVHLVVSLTGGQGCLFGRGNQQISAAVLALVGAANLHVLASATKIAQLPDGQVFVDTGDPDIDVRYSGFIRVHTAPGRSVMLRVTH